MKSKATFLIWLGFVFLLFGMVALACQNFFSQKTWYVFIGLGLITIFYDRLEQLDFLGLKFRLKRAKEELNDEANKIELRLLIISLTLDSSPTEREKVRAFFQAGKINSEIIISQSNEFILSSLKERDCIDYKKGGGGLTTNSCGDTKRKYQVTLLKNSYEL